MKITSFFASLIFCLMVGANSSVEVIKVKGKVTYQGRTLAVGSHIKEGQYIEVQGFVQLKFADGSKMLLRDGRAKVETVKGNQNTINLLRGTLFSYKVKSSTKLNVRTPKAVFAVRGTKFFLQEKKESSYLCVCDGVVNVRNEKGTVDIGRDQDIHVKTGQKLQKAKATPQMIDMVWDGFNLMGISRS